MSLISANLRDAVVARADNRCEYCFLSQELQVATFPVDHIIPVVITGRTILENLALSCPRCNLKKGTRVDAPDPSTGEMIPLFNPRTQHWAEHFRPSKQPPLITLNEPIPRPGIPPADLLDQQAVSVGGHTFRVQD